MAKTADIFTPLNLPNRQTIPNRICKAAMEENLCEPSQIPGKSLFTLYDNWAKGGAGLILTGNVMISPYALTGPGGVVLQDETHLDAFKEWARIGTSGGAQFWMQISHPGRQVYAAMGQDAVAPSETSVDIPGFSKLFANARALTGDEIEGLITRFATTAALAEKAGFTGVQIHGAHGYLISQFLSPLVNKRDDQWGGSLENRARFLMRVISEVRATVSPDFCVSVKLNSADFQKGGFDASDARQVVMWLNDMDVDLVELSGGSYESPAMQGRAADNSTGLREAYFIDFARDIAAVAEMPLMVTGGIARKTVADAALEQDAGGFGVSMLGIARAMAFEPDLPNAWKAGEKLEVSLPDVNWKKKAMASLAVMALTKAQLERMAKGKDPKYGLSPLIALISSQLKTKKRTKRYRKWVESL